MSETRSTIARKRDTLKLREEENQERSARRAAGQETRYTRCICLFIQEVKKMRMNEVEKEMRLCGGIARKAQFEFRYLGVVAVVIK